MVAFFLGLYAITGLIWGRAWMKATFFPYFLFAFMLPLTNDMEGLTLPLRQLATKLTVLVSQGLGIDVVQQGTQIFDRANRFTSAAQPLACTHAARSRDRVGRQSSAR